jgi:hypothetical protein
MLRAFVVKKARLLPSKTRFSGRKRRQIAEKRGVSRPISFRETSDFNALRRPFLPSPHRSAEPSGRVTPFHVRERLDRVRLRPNPNAMPDFLKRQYFVFFFLGLALSPMALTS